MSSFEFIYSTVGCHIAEVRHQINALCDRILHANKLPHIVMYKDGCPMLKWFWLRRQMTHADDQKTHSIHDASAHAHLHTDWDKTLEILMFEHLFLFEHDSSDGIRLLLFFYAKIQFYSSRKVICCYLCDFQVLSWNNSGFVENCRDELVTSWSITELNDYWSMTSSHWLPRLVQ